MKPGIELAADGRAADPVVLLDDADLQPGLRQIAGGDQAVVAGADDHGVIGHARFSASTCSSVQVDGRFDRLQRIGQAGSSSMRLAHEPGLAAVRLADDAEIMQVIGHRVVEAVVGLSSSRGNCPAASRRRTGRTCEDGR